MLVVEFNLNQAEALLDTVQTGLISGVLRSSSEHEDADMISDEDYICTNCYKSHLALVRSYEETSSCSDIHLNDVIAI